MQTFDDPDKRPDCVEWVDEFGEHHWKSPDVDDKMAKQSLITLMNAMKGRKVHEVQRKAAEFVAAHKAWPALRDGNVTINVLRLEDIEQAKMKAGLIPKLIGTPAISNKEPESDVDPVEAQSRPKRF